MPDERAAADQVAAFWDALVLHEDTNDLDVVEGVAAALARFQAMGTASPLGARQRVWQRVQAAQSHQKQCDDHLPFAVMPTLPASNASVVLDSPWVLRRSRFAWASTYVPTAALLVVTFLISAMALGSARFDWNPVTAPLLRLPAFEKAPIPAADPATAQGALTEVSVSALPPQAGYIGIESWTYPPLSDPITTSPLTGPMLVFVTSGQLTASVEGEGAMLRGLDPASSVAMLMPTTGQILAGETLLVPAQAQLTTSNPSATTATALVVQILSGTASDWVLPFNQTMIAEKELVSGWGEFSQGPAQIALRRATLEPGQTVPAPPVGTFQLVGAESKYLGYLTRTPDGAATNREKESLVVLIVTVSQSDQP